MSPFLIHSEVRHWNQCIGVTEESLDVQAAHPLVGKGQLKSSHSCGGTVKNCNVTEGEDF